MRSLLRLLVIMSVSMGLAFIFIILFVYKSGFTQEAEAPACPGVRVQKQGHVKTFVTWIPSEAAPERGIVIRVVFPELQRYPGGAAAIVEVPGSDIPGDISLPPKALQQNLYANHGLIQVVFAFPGGGKPPFNSGGVYDHRGISSLMTVRDVVRFIRGELKEQNGCSINDLLPYGITQLGLIGSSNGGNTAITTLGIFGEEMAVDWYVGWENPAGMQFTTVDLGFRDQINPAYLPGGCQPTSQGVECDVDYSQLRWDPEAVQRQVPPGGGRHGILYHDFNGNGRYDQTDYALGTYTGSFPKGEKRVFSLPAIEAAVERNLLNPWPEDVATLDETREFWEIRDMSRYYPDVVKSLPHLRVIVIGSKEDHVQGTPDYPHIVLQYQGWLKEDTGWVRLNPDASYVQWVKGQILPLSDNDANLRVDYANISCLVEPESGFSDKELRLAAALELSDRFYRMNWDANLTQVLVPFEPLSH